MESMQEEVDLIEDEAFKNMVIDSARAFLAKVLLYSNEPERLYNLVENEKVQIEIIADWLGRIK